MSIPIIILIATIIAYFASLWKLFQKAGKPAWAGFVPGYNFLVWQKITDRPWYWVLILFIPGVQFLMLIIMNVQLAWSFGKRGTTNTILAIVAPFYLIPKIAFSEDLKYTGNVNWKQDKKGGGREWADALLFAIVVAFIVRTFVFEAFTIPTPSMEKSMLVGDYLFVSKARYGAKIPETPISFPLTHHTLPILNVPSYLDWQKLDYHRLPGWSDVELGDPVVFNYPLGDTVITQDEVTSWYQYKRNFGYQMAGSQAKFMEAPEKYMESAAKRMQMDDRFSVVVRPKDKKENYVKRCVGMPGQVLEIQDGLLLLDGEPMREIPGLQHDYKTFTSLSVTNATLDKLKDEFGINYSDFRRDINGKLIRDPYIVSLTEEQFGNMKSLNYVDSIFIDWAPAESSFKQGIWALFPNHPDYSWSVDNFGPLKIPAKGMTIELNMDNLPLYRRAIEAYEENELKVKDGKILINGTESSSYTFTLDYYWMMGDNRHRSQDSRYFGFVPEDHVVGRPSFVWLSLDQELGLFDGKIRFSRMFKGVD